MLLDITEMFELSGFLCFLLCLFSVSADLILSMEFTLFVCVFTFLYSQFSFSFSYVMSDLNTAEVV